MHYLGVVRCGSARSPMRLSAAPSAAVIVRQRKRQLSSAAATIHQNFQDKYGKKTQEALASMGGMHINRNLSLDDIIKKDKISPLTSNSIAEIWHEYHKNKPFSSSLVISDSTYATWIGERARESPSFIIPVRMPTSGWLIYLVQHILPGTSSSNAGMAIYTRLIDFQQWGPGASARMVTHAFPDLVADKGIALTRSNFDGDSLNREQAEALLKTTIDYYCGNQDYEWVKQFNHHPSTFNFDSFMAHHISKYSK